jgi:hypothetical protein
MPTSADGASGSRSSQAQPQADQQQSSNQANHSVADVARRSRPDGRTPDPQRMEIAREVAKNAAEKANHNKLGAGVAYWAERGQQLYRVPAWGPKEFSAAARNASDAPRSALRQPGVPRQDGSRAPVKKNVRFVR